MIPSQFHPPAGLTTSIAKIQLTPQEVIEQLALLRILVPVSARLDILTIPDVWFTTETAAKEERDNEKKWLLAAVTVEGTVRDNQRDMSGSGVIGKRWLAGRLCPEPTTGSTPITKFCMSQAHCIIYPTSSELPPFQFLNYPKV